MSFWKELQRRNVFRVAAAYVVVAWLLVQVTETILPIFDVPDVFLRGVILILLIGFPLAIFFAWAFELTPEGVKREKEVDRERSVTPATGRKLDRVIIVVLLVAVGYFLLDEFVLEPQEAEVGQATALEVSGDAGPEAEDASIAVLPFVNMSDDEGNEYFAEGIAEELLTLLARVDDLRVISRSSSFAFKGQNIGMGEIADRLGVAHILDGSVRKAGNQVRVAVRLIDARSDEQRWSESFDRELDNIFAIQDEIASSVVDRLKGTLLSDAPTAEPRNPKAFDLYLQAREVARNMTDDALERSNALYRRSLAIDPDYAEAWSGLGGNYVNLALRSQQSSTQEARQQAREALERALSIDGELALAHSRLAGLALMENELQEAARRAQRALELAPTDPNVVHNAVFVPTYLGRLEQALELQEFVIEIDPVSAISYQFLGTLYFFDGKWEAAADAFEVAIELNPNYPEIMHGLGGVRLQQGRLDDAMAAFQRETNEALRRWGVAMVLFARGETESFERLRTEWLESWGEDRSTLAAQLSAYSEHPDDAFRWLRLAEEQNNPAVAVQFLEHSYDPVRDDPRWQEFLHRIGRTPEQLDAIEFELPANLRQ